MSPASLWAVASPVGLSLAFWPVWRWYVLRLADGSDERWGLLALATALVLAWHAHAPSPPRQDALHIVAVPVAVYAVTFPLLPPLAHAILAVVAVGLFVSQAYLPRPVQAPICGLLLLALPVEATAQFVIGYPLRVLVARGSASLLALGGLAVEPRGSGLSWAGETVLVDAPCSGVRMLWAGLFLALVLACLHGLGAGRTAALVTAALALTLAANTGRAAVLFLAEAQVVRAPAWAHEAVGVLAFILAALAVAWLASRLRREGPCVAPASS
jgi:exosortase/archaeosortase family protein